MNAEFISTPCTSIEQSRRLLTLGLKRETADMIYVPHYDTNGQIKHYFPPKVLEGKLREYIIKNDLDFSDYIPAWSMYRLIEMGFHKGIGIIVVKDAYNYMISHIESRINTGVFNKDYLEESNE